MDKPIVSVRLEQSDQDIIYIADLSLTSAFLFMGVIILLGAFLLRMDNGEG